MWNKTLLLCALLFFSLQATSRQKITPWVSDDVFKTACFIENKGQFEKLQAAMNNVEFAIVHNRDEIYFTPQGIHFHLFKRTPLTGHSDDPNEHEEDGEEDKKKYLTEESWVRMEWLNTNGDIQYDAFEKTSHYFTYGDAMYNSYGFKKLLARNLYPNIDVAFEVKKEGGIKYTLILHPGADLANVRYRYQSKDPLVIDNQYNKLIIRNDVYDLSESEIDAYYENGEKVELGYSVSPEQVISFRAATKIDRQRKLIIDPWVTVVTTLTGQIQSQNKAYDVDYDSQGSLFALGGGGGTGNSIDVPKIAKYDIAGNLLWTFGGIVLTPFWSSSPTAKYVGNFIVDKQSGKVYFSQGFYQALGARIIRLDQNGNYDNFISAQYSNFEEIWEFKFNCNTGQLIAMGGGTNSNINFGIVDTTTGTITISNVTGNAAFHQDAVNASINGNGECFILFNTWNAATNNYIFKLNNTYTASLWNTYCGFNVLSYAPQNKNYANLYSLGHNCLSVSNNDKLYYYDGKNIKAFNSVTGLPVGSALTLPGGGITQGGIYANGCDDVYIGEDNGTIVRYFFNGTTFTNVATIPIQGQSGHVHDIVHSPISNLLYVCGNGYVATIDPNSVCTTGVVNNIQLQYTAQCNGVATVTVLNPDPNSFYSFVWYDSTTATTVQTTVNPGGVYTDTFFNAVFQHHYSVTVIRSSSCQIYSNSIAFIAPALYQYVVNASICTGGSYTLPGGAIVNATGIYIDTLAGVNCDTIVTTNLSVLSQLNVVQNPQICQGSNYLLPGGMLVNTAGIYSDTLMAVSGCDSIITTNLAVVPVSQVSVNAAICQGSSYTLPGGLIVNAAGIYIDTLLATSGCDSIITTNLSVNAVLQLNVSSAICQGNTYQLPGGGIVNIGGIYSDTLTGAGGCDSLITTTLTVLPVSQFQQNVTICQGSSFIRPGGQVVSLSGTYSDTLVNALGCDSVITTNLSVVTLILSNTQAFICQGDSYQLPGGSLVTISGMYTDTLFGINGCDSVIVTNLSVYNPGSGNVQAILCSGSAYTLPGGMVVTAPGIYTDTLNTNFGCDSVVTTNLLPGQLSISNPQIHICSNQSYTLPGGAVVNVAGIYTDIIPNAIGCDSIINTHLQITEIPKFELGNDTAICRFEPLTLRIEPQGGQVWWADDFYKNIRILNEAGTYIAGIIKEPCPVILDTIKITLANCNCEIFIPNAFSPNKDQKNDEFRPLFSCKDIDPATYRFRVFNRWGQQVFSTNLYFDGWDGFFKGTEAENGVYMYSLQFINPYTGKKEFYKGDVSLLR